jgi:glycolate oxidase FAD binding subunit
MRDLVIGVTLVLADGTIASSGGKVVKNVAGYDLGKLFSGSHGRLGLIARVALRLHGRPAAEATVVAETGEPRDLWHELHRSQLEPSAVDLLPGRVALLYEGGHAAVEAQVAASPGERADGTIWEESARRQAGAGSRARFDWQECLLARPGPGIAYVADPSERTWSPLAERVRASFDPEGILV